MFMFIYIGLYRTGFILHKVYFYVFYVTDLVLDLYKKNSLRFDLRPNPKKNMVYGTLCRS
jgi:hypothetical protein